MKNKLSQVLITLFLFCSNLAWAHDGHNQVQPTPSADSQVELVALSDSGKHITVTFAEEPTLETSTANVCHDSDADLESAALWMPSMGHGSSPTSIVLPALATDCTQVNDLLFLMAGDWELRLSFSDGDKAVIQLKIAEDPRVFKKMSAKKMRMRLMFADGPSINTESAVLCTEQVVKVSSVVLWMPDHGHGSTPTTLSAVAGKPTCTQINAIDFLMMGNWEIRINFDNGDSGVFYVSI